MYVGRGTAEHEFDIGHRCLGAHLNECMQSAGHNSPWSGAEQPGLDHADRHAVKPHLAVERTRLGTYKGEKYREVVLKIATDRQINCWLDPNLAQMRCRSDAGQHQNLWCAKGAARNNHLAKY